MIGKPKVAGAPISWGVSELPGWGYRMQPDRVLAEMNEVGLEATELGPPGYLPEDQDERSELLDRHGLRLIAGFRAAVLHDRSRRALDEIEQSARTLEASGAEVLVLAAALPGESYDRDERLAPADWIALAEALVAAEELASAHRLRLAFHPHAGTAVAQKEDIYTLLETTSVEICLDTGHLFLGGADPVAIARDAAGRVSHVHLKDVDARLAGLVRTATARSGLETLTARRLSVGSRMPDIGAGSCSSRIRRLLSSRRRPTVHSWRRARALSTFVEQSAPSSTSPQSKED